MAFNEEEVDEDSPAEADDAPEAPAEPVAAGPEDAPAAPAEEEEAPAADEPASAPEDPKEDDTIVVTGHKKAASPLPPTAQDLDNEDALFAQDMQRGHIKPETMQGLFDKKDTLGKVGTLFGLLVSGAGSGLSGQPNAVLEMMNNQIKNDLEGQRLSNENAQNWLRLSQAHQRQKFENAYTQAQTGKIPSEIARNEAETKRATAGADLEATNSAMTKMRIAASGQIEDMIKKMPDGPNKQAMIDTYQNKFLPSIIGANQQDNAQTAAKVGTLHAINQAQQPKPKNDAGSSGVQMVDPQKIAAMGLRGRRAESAGVAAPEGAIPAAAYPLVMKEASDVNKNRAVYSTISRAFEDLDKQAAGGQLDKGSYDTVLTHVVGNLEKVVTRDEAVRLAKSMLPSASDLLSPKARQTKATQMWEQFKNNEAGATNLSAIPGLMPAFPAPPKVSPDKGNAAKSLVNKAIDIVGGKSSSKKKDSGDQYKIVNGVKYKRGPDGRAVKVD